MLNLERLNQISKIPTASWAIWNENGESDLAFFRAKMNLLHGRVIILGLNRGNRARRQETIPFVNFHTPKHRGDKRLEQFIQGQQLSQIIGGYMTDLSLEIETDSKLVDIAYPQAAVDDLRSQLSFSKESLRTIVCIGDKTFETLCKGLSLTHARHKKDESNFNLRAAKSEVEGEQWILYRVWMHSSYGMNEDKGGVELPRQLKYINNQVVC